MQPLPCKVGASPHTWQSRNGLWEHSLWADLPHIVTWWYMPGVVSRYNCVCPGCLLRHSKSPQTLSCWLKTTAIICLAHKSATGWGSLSQLHMVSAGVARSLGAGIIWRYLIHISGSICRLLAGTSAGCGLSMWPGLPHNMVARFQGQVSQEGQAEAVSLSMT